MTRMPSLARDRHRSLPWLMALVVAQASIVMYRQWLDAASFPPISLAQGEVLESIYSLSARLSTSGLLEAWRGSPGGGHTSVALLIAGLVEVFGGGGRLALLLPGSVLLLASEVAFAAAALRLTRSPGLAAVGLGLLLLRTRPWLASTGVFAVNADWLALCGVVLATCLMIAAPADRAAVRACLCAGIGLLTLCFSAAAFACLLVIVALRLAITADLARPKAGTVGICLALTAGAVALLWLGDACPIATATGIRLDGGMAARCGYGLRTSLLYFVSFGLGLAYLIAAPVALGAVMAHHWLCRDRTTACPLERFSLGEPAFLAAVLVALAGIQVMCRSANPIGSGLADVPLTALLLTVPRALAHRSGVTPRRLTGPAPLGFLAVCAILPSLYPLLDAPVRDIGQRRAASEIASWLIADAESNGRPRARILAASLPTLIDGPGLSALFYETFGELAAFDVTERTADAGILGALDYAVVPHQALSSLAGTELERRLDAALVRRARLDPQGRDLVVFSAPVISIAGVSGDWLTATGTSLHFTDGEIPSGSVIALHGPDGYARYMPDPPIVTAVGTTRSAANVSLPVRFMRGDDGYTILLDPGPLTVAGGGRADVSLTFSRFFVPLEVGLNQDARKLAVMAPTAVGLAPRAAFDAGSAGRP